MSTEAASTGLIPFFERERQRILDACTGCGKCFEACPMVPFLDLKAPDGPAIVAGVLGVVGRQPLPSGSPAGDDALKWVMGCTGSGLCIPACPDAVDPKLMLRIARITALGGLGDPKLASKPEDVNWFPRVRAFARTQLSDDEQKEWM